MFVNKMCGTGFAEELQELNSSGLLRELKTIKPYKDAHILFNGKKYLNFSSNDYLGLSQDTRVIESAQRALLTYGAGAVSSRLLSGSFDIHEELESALAKFKHSEAALVFPSGYQTNLSVISSLLAEEDCAIIDRLNHASIIDGVKLSKAKILVYRHADANDLERVLKFASKYRRKLIITDGIFSMDGDLAPLKEISYLAEKHSALLMVDEAHSTGIFGKTGSGVAEYLNLEDKIDIKMGTLSKAIGSQGGFVCLSKDLKNYIVNKARGFIYTTALSPVCAAAALESIRIIQDVSSVSIRERLLKNAAYFIGKLKEMGFNTLNSQSQIIPILIGDTHRTKEVADYMFSKGFYTPSIRYPTVPKDMSRLRVSLTAKHTVEDINKFCEALKELKV